jgi:antitoxin component YwqK of YwqJK toxin-antitoxin module
MIHKRSPVYTATLRGIAAISVSACGAPPSPHASTPHRPVPASWRGSPELADPDERERFDHSTRFQQAAHEVACEANHRARARVERNHEGGPDGCVIWCEASAGVRDGAFIAAMTFDDAIVRGRYIAGVPTGRWTETSHGRLVREELYDASGLLDGEQRMLAPNGTLLVRQHFVHGTRAGTYESFFPDGSMQARARFAIGATIGATALADVPEPPLPLAADARAMDSRASVPVGAFQEWYADGQLKTTRRFDEAGRPDGAFCDFSPGGGLIACQSLVKGTGTFVQYDEVKRPLERWSFRSGELSGVHEQWTDVHVLALHEEYRAGKLHGITRKFDERGRLVSSQTYRAGELDGESFEQSFDGDATSEVITGSYCAGTKCGRWTRVAPSARQREVEIYDRAGQRVGAVSESQGVITESWSQEGERRKRHARCIAGLARGDCCDPEQEPPPGATICKNGPR